MEKETNQFGVERSSYKKRNSNIISVPEGWREAVRSRHVREGALLERCTQYDHGGQSRKSGSKKVSCGLELCLSPIFL